MAIELPEAELDIMSCLWKHGPSTAREIREALHERRPLAHASVCTLLRRLEEKGHVSRDKAGRGKAYRYAAKLEPTGTARHLLDKLLDRVFGGSGVALVASLLESRPPTAKELDELQALLDQLKQHGARHPQRRRRS